MNLTEQDLILAGIRSFLKRHLLQEMAEEGGRQ